MTLTKTINLMADIEKRKLRYRQAHQIDEIEMIMMIELASQMSRGREVTVMSLSLSAGAPASTSYRRLQRLEKCGLIVRAKCDGDGRQRSVSLTDKGQETMAALTRDVSRPMESMMKEVTP